MRPRVTRLTSGMGCYLPITLRYSYRTLRCVGCLTLHGVKHKSHVTFKVICWPVTSLQSRHIRHVRTRRPSTARPVTKGKPSRDPQNRRHASVINSFGQRRMCREPRSWASSCIHRRAPIVHLILIIGRKCRSSSRLPCRYLRASPPQ